MQPGDYVQHDNGTFGEVERVEGAYVVLKNDKHRYAMRLLTVIVPPAPAASKPEAANEVQNERT